MQDLSGFSVPKGFRGSNAIKVQLWWAVQATIFSGRHKYCIAGGFFITFIRRKNRKKRSYSSVSKITYPWKLTLGDYAWVGDEVNLYTLGEITIGAHSVISQKVIYAPGATTMQVNISPLTPRLL